MKISILRESLLKPLQLVSGVIERQQTLPILSNLMLSVSEERLAMTATDLEVELTGYIPLDERASDIGETTVSARKLVDICRTLPEKSQIEFVTEGARLAVHSGKSKFTLLTLPASEFPAIDESGSNQVEFKLPQATLKKMLSKTAFSMAQQDVRYYLNGMLFEINNNVIKLVAADGHRLALSVSEELDLAGQSLQVIIPRKGVIELIRLLGDTGEIEVSVGSNFIRAVTPQFMYTSKIIEGKFPNYDKVVPKNCNKEIICARSELKQALTRVAILSNEKFRGIRLAVSNNLLRLFANNPEQEEAEEEISAQYRGADLEVGFNVNYLLDICNITATENLKLFLSDSSSALLIEEIGSEGQLYVVMPMEL